MIKLNALRATNFALLCAAFLFIGAIVVGAV